MKYNESHDYGKDAIKAEVEDRKHQIASELADSGPRNDDWGNVPSRDCGRIGGQIGGNMVRDMIRMAEQQLIGQQQKD